MEITAITAQNLQLSLINRRIEEKRREYFLPVIIFLLCLIPATLIGSDALDFFAFICVGIAMAILVKGILRAMSSDGDHYWLYIKRGGDKAIGDDLPSLSLLGNLECSVHTVVPKKITVSIEKKELSETSVFEGILVSDPEILWDINIQEVRDSIFLFLAYPPHKKSNENPSFKKYFCSHAITYLNEPLEF